MDISDTLAPSSDQLDAVDLSASGPRTFTVQDVSKGSPDQPVNVKLAEFDRVWRPGKSMRRVLGKLWGTDATAWRGRRLTLFCDDTVMFGGEAVGGIRISHMSDIKGVQTVPLIVTRGRSKGYKVQPLAESKAPTSNPAAVLLAEIGRLADRTPEGRQGAVDAWAASHDGEPIAQATDIGGLELLRDDLASQVPA